MIVISGSLPVKSQSERVAGARSGTKQNVRVYTRQSLLRASRKFLNLFFHENKSSIAFREDTRPSLGELTTTTIA